MSKTEVHQCGSTFSSRSSFPINCVFLQYLAPKHMIRPTFQERFHNYRSIAVFCSSFNDQLGYSCSHSNQNYIAARSHIYVLRHSDQVRLVRVGKFEFQRQRAAIVSSPYTKRGNAIKHTCTASSSLPL